MTPRYKTKLQKTVVGLKIFHMIDMHTRLDRPQSQLDSYLSQAGLAIQGSILSCHERWLWKRKKLMPRN